MDSFLRVTTVTTFTFSLEYQPWPFNTVTPRCAFCVIASAISVYLGENMKNCTDWRMPLIYMSSVRLVTVIAISPYMTLSMPESGKNPDEQMMSTSVNRSARPRVIVRYLLIILAMMSVPPDEPLFVNANPMPMPSIRPANMDDMKGSNIGNCSPVNCWYRSRNGIHNHMVRHNTPNIERMLN